MVEPPSASDKIICSECSNDTFRIYSTSRKSTWISSGYASMNLSEERLVVCAECGHSESLYKIGENDE